jgi:hypothetical protein
MFGQPVYNVFYKDRPNDGEVLDDGDEVLAF